MTTPNHGTRARYNTPHSCRCGACKVANGKYRKLRAADRAQGRNRRTDATPVREHLWYLADQGVSPRDVARAARVSDSVVYETRNGRHKNLDKRIAAALLAVTPKTARARGNALVDSTGTVRRVRALAVQGWNASRMADRLEVAHDTTCRLLAGRGTVTADVRDRIAVGYRRLVTERPPEWTARDKYEADRARDLARRNGWAGPLAWDDIDNDAAPVDVAPYRPASKPMQAFELAEMGLADVEIATRLGVKPYTVRDYLSRRVAA